MGNNVHVQSDAIGAILLLQFICGMKETARLSAVFGICLLCRTGEV